MSQGCYVCLEDAHRLIAALPGAEAHAEPALRRLFRIAVLLDLREKELGIVDESRGIRAREIADELQPKNGNEMLELSHSLPERAGYVEDTTVESIENLRTLWALQETPFWTELENSAAHDSFHAYLLLSALCAAGREPDAFQRKATELTPLHGDSPIVLFVASSCRAEDQEAFEEMLDNASRYHEARFFLGKYYYKNRRFAEADAQLQKAFDAFPDSLAIAQTLADMAFELEDMERSQKLYQSVVQRSPSHRDAILGNAKALGYLGRHDAAMGELNKLLELGSIYLGEAHYWLAWNEYQLNRFDDARLETDAAKRYQPMDSNTFFLSGVIAINENDLTRARDELEEALRLDATNCEAASQLGNVLSSSKENTSAATSYETAAACFAEREATLLERVQALRGSPDPSLHSLLVKRERQLEETRYEIASAFFSAAREHSSVGNNARALLCLDFAAEHPRFAEQAEQIRKTLTP